MLSDEYVNEIDYEADSAMVCIGNALIGDCKKAKAIVETKNSGIVEYEIMGSN